MKFKEFKKGDYIHRRKPISFNGTFMDRSYMSNPLIFLRSTRNLAFCTDPQIKTVQNFDKFTWDDDNWCRWPRKVEKQLNELLKT